MGMLRVNLRSSVQWHQERLWSRVPHLAGIVGAGMRRPVMPTIMGATRVSGGFRRGGQHASAAFHRPMPAGSTYLDCVGSCHLGRPGWNSWCQLPLPVEARRRLGEWREHVGWCCRLGSVEDSRGGAERDAAWFGVRAVHHRISLVALILHQRNMSILPPVHGYFPLHARGTSCWVAEQSPRGAKEQYPKRPDRRNAWVGSFHTVHFVLRCHQLLGICLSIMYHLPVVVDRCRA